MTDLTDFLLARIAEDEQAARSPAAAGSPAPHRLTCAYGILDYNEPCTCHYPARVLAECEAKREIVELHADAGMGDCAWASDPCPTLRALALPYADHPAYDEQWRP